MKKCRPIIAVLVLVLAAPVAACPGFLFIESFGPKITSGKRRELNLFTKEAASKSGWKRVPLQIDAFNEEGRLEQHKIDDTWLEKPFGPLDRLTFYTNSFGKRFERQENFPCETNRIFELRNHEEQYGYLAFCKNADMDNKQKPVHSLAHDAVAGQVHSKDYLYRYAPENHLMFNLFAASYDQPFQYPLVIGENADQYIRGDVKNFFTLTFDKKDIDAHMAYEVNGPVGLIGSLDFFLSIMFFSINLKLAPEVSFFEDTVFMPMVMHLPVDAREYLNPGSGLYYTWKPGRDVLFDPKNSKVPTIDVKKSKTNPKDLAALGLPFCKTDVCRYRITGETGLKFFSLDFNIAKPLVEKGFFPQFIADNKKTEADFGWPISTRDEPGRLGLYFETSGLPQGNHAWEFLIRFASKASDLDLICPVPVYTLSSYTK